MHQALEHHGSEGKVGGNDDAYAFRAGAFIHELDCVVPEAGGACDEADSRFESRVGCVYSCVGVGEIHNNAGTGLEDEGRKGLRRGGWNRSHRAAGFCCQA